MTYGLSFFEWFSEEARRINGDVVAAPTNTKQLVFIREPIGVAAMITPWNFPNAMITRKVRFEIIIQGYSSGHGITFVDFKL